MLENFFQNALFNEKIKKIDNKNLLIQQLEEIIQFSHECGLDWYFTKIPDLRCGVRLQDSDVAKVVAFRVWYKSSSYIRIDADIFGISEKMPISKNKMKTIKDGIKAFSSDNVSDGKIIGLFPNDYDDRDIDSLSFEMAVEESFKLSSNERLNLLAKKSGKPRVSRRYVKFFERDPNIVAEALYLAEGICGDCKSKAPFLRKSNGQPYLEVHHIKFLSEGGEDTLENVIALCPNCHRQRHHG